MTLGTRGAHGYTSPPHPRAMQPAATDTDSDFPSGPWTGFWLEPHTGATRHRQDLSLTFTDGRIRGVGADGVGAFRILGRYDASERSVTFHKIYRTHVVDYRGYRELVRGIWGTWAIDGFRGGFHIWPVGRGEGVEQHVAAEADTPTLPMTVPLRTAAR